MGCFPWSACPAGRKKDPRPSGLQAIWAGIRWWWCVSGELCTPDGTVVQASLRMGSDSS